MLSTSLEFAPGTTDDCKKLVVGLFQPGEIVGAYRQARSQLKTSDLVLVVSQADPHGFNIEPRTEYVRRMSRALGANAPKTMHTLGIASNSAHKVAQLPLDLDAMWLVIVRGQEIPVMCVLFTTPYEVTATAN
jgi:hypothetical protein